jgi:SHS family lactate transporter-like MFS transporter
LTTPKASAAAPQSAGDHVAALMASFLGWTLDAFDFFLVIFCLTAIGKEFGKADKAIALSVTITLAFRPVGAFIFGLLADRYGRRIPMVINLLFYSIAEVATGFAPNYTSFLILRAIFGIGMGGNWGVGASLAMEKVPARIRGLLSGFLQQGYSLGYLLAAVCYFFLFDKIGWRPLFYIGGLPSLLSLFVLFRVKESEVWQKNKHESWSGLGRAIGSHWKLFLYLMLLMTMMNFASHGTQDMYPTFLERQWHFTARERSATTAFSMLGAIIGGIGVGYLSDHWGRRRSIIASLVLAVLAIPLWAYSPSVVMLLAGAFLMQFMVQGAWGVIPAHLAELSPNSVRGFLPGFAYQCGVLLASSVVYIEALFAERVSYGTAMALTASIVFVSAAVVAGLGKERRGEIFTVTEAATATQPSGPLKSITPRPFE